MKPSDNEIEMLSAGFAIQHKNGLIRFAHALLEKYASARAIAFDDWLAKHCDSDDLTAYERELAWDAWNAALFASQTIAEVRVVEPVYAYRRKGLDNFVTCDRERFDELSAKPRLFETRTFYAAPEQTVEPLTLPGIDADRLRAIASSGSQTAMSNALLNVARALKTQADKDGGDCAKGAGDAEDAARYRLAASDCILILRGDAALGRAEWDRKLDRLATQKGAK